MRGFIKFASVQDVSLEVLDDLEPYPSLWPDISGARWEAFLGSLRDNGQRQAVVVVGNKGRYFLIDGYQRRRAAKELGWSTLRANVIAADYWANLDSDGRLKLVEDLNEHRRHLVFSQKVAKFNTNKEKLGVKQGGEQSAKSALCSDAAENAGYSSVRQAQDDAKLHSETVPEVHKALDDNLLTKSCAKEIAKLPQSEQPQEVARMLSEPKRIKMNGRSPMVEFQLACQKARKQLTTDQMRRVFESVISC